MRLKINETKKLMKLKNNSDSKANPGLHTSHDGKEQYEPIVQFCRTSLKTCSFCVADMHSSTHWRDTPMEIYQLLRKG